MQSGSIVGRRLNDGRLPRLIGRLDRVRFDQLIRRLDRLGGGFGVVRHGGRHLERRWDSRVGRHAAVRRQSRQFGTQLRNLGIAALGQRPDGEAAPERHDLIGGRLAPPSGVQEGLRQRPQMHRVGRAPRQRIARQCQRDARVQQRVGACVGHTGVCGVDGPQLLPALGSIQELRGHAAQRVVRTRQVVAAHRQNRGTALRRIREGVGRVDIGACGDLDLPAAIDLVAAVRLVFAAAV